MSKEVCANFSQFMGNMDSFIAKLETDLKQKHSVSPFGELKTKYGVATDAAADGNKEETKQAGGDAPKGKKEKGTKKAKGDPAKYQEAMQNGGKGDVSKKEKAPKKEQAPVAPKEKAPAAEAEPSRAPGPLPDGTPKTVRTYFDDTYLFEMKAKIHTIVAPSETNAEFQIILDKTIFHPQGGGQPKDRGTISSSNATFEVSDMLEKDGVICHFGKFTSEGAKFDSGSEVDLKIDGAYRSINARIHSAGHLLDMAMTRAGKTELKPGKGYHFEEGPYVEYIGVVSEKERAPLCETLNKHCADIIAEAKAANTQVFRKICAYEEANEQLAGAGGIPSYVPAGGELRVLKLTPDDLGCPCGGTHVHAVPEIGRIEVTAMKKKKQNTQVKYKVVMA